MLYICDECMRMFAIGFVFETEENDHEDYFWAYPVADLNENQEKKYQKDDRGSRCTVGI